jgi:hypothetical protein
MVNETSLYAAVKHQVMTTERQDFEELGQHLKHAAQRQRFFCVRSYHVMNDQQKYPHTRMNLFPKKVLQ